MVDFLPVPAESVSYLITSLDTEWQSGCKENAWMRLWRCPSCRGPSLRRPVRFAQDDNDNK
jgi:hypothetical protein